MKTVTSVDDFMKIVSDSEGKNVRSRSISSLLYTTSASSLTCDAALSSAARAHRCCVPAPVLLCLVLPRMKKLHPGLARSREAELPRLGTSGPRGGRWGRKRRGEHTQSARSATRCAGLGCSQFQGCSRALGPCFTFIRRSQVAAWRALHRTGGAALHGRAKSSSCICPARPPASQKAQRTSTHSLVLLPPACCPARSLSTSPPRGAAPAK